MLLVELQLLDDRIGNIFGELSFLIREVSPIFVPSCLSVLGDLQLLVGLVDFLENLSQADDGFLKGFL